MTGTAFGLGMPVACTAIGLAAHLGWVLPWDGRRSLRATVDIIMKDVEVDEQRQHIPAHAQTVLLFNAVLRSVAEDPDHWRSRLSTELPFVDGSPLPLSAVERARLDRYVGRLATALGRYGRRVRFGGGRVAQDVAGVIFDPRSYWNAIDLTGSGGDPARPDPSARAIDVTGTGPIDVRTETRGRSRGEQRAGARARSRTVSETASRPAPPASGGVESGAEPLTLSGVESGTEPLVLGGGEPGFQLEPGAGSPASSGAAAPSSTSESNGTGVEQSEAWSDTGIRSVAGVELGIRAGSGAEGESASGATPDRRGPRRRSRH